MNIAICLSGAISKIGGRFLTPNSLYKKSNYINITACFNSTIKHIIEANKEHTFDFFIHSWNEDLKEKLLSLYNPKKYLFEDNSLYIDEISKKILIPEEFGGVSRSLSIKKSIELLEQYQKENIINYDRVMIYRPDVLLIKNLDINTYEDNKIYVNAHPEGQGDFHFIMNFLSALKFKNLYNSIELGNPHKTHFWIKNYINKFMKQELIMDDIVPGLHQEVLRKINSTSIKELHIKIDDILIYGLTQEEICQYN